MPVVAPASAYWLANEYYKSDEEFVYALADVLHEEYQAIIESGAFLQVDDAVLMHEADTMLSRGQSWEDYRAWARVRVDALNHALRGLPEDRIRYHVCFGSWHGPHAYDPPLRDSIDLVLGRERQVLPDGAGQPAARARVEDLGGRARCRTARSWCPASSPTTPTWSSTRSSSPSGWSGWRTSSAGSG